MCESLISGEKKQRVQRYGSFWNNKNPWRKSLEDNVGWGKEGGNQVSTGGYNFWKTLGCHALIKNWLICNFVIKLDCFFKYRNCPQTMDFLYSLFMPVGQLPQCPCCNMILYRCLLVIIWFFLYRTDLKPEIPKFSFWVEFPLLITFEDAFICPL